MPYDVSNLAEFLIDSDGDRDDIHPDSPTVSMRTTGEDGTVMVDAKTHGYCAQFRITIEPLGLVG